ncbi:B3 domain-containing protein [Zea mays]|uniref:B3 domain-containing protein n=2 Tax=Zea mays TaxID=4577 RepID=A0A3L6EPY9_MAIZE|nr:B3 domain-containing protein [Zea mays]PWZ22925.1 B3 domain-containing protein [Zea mays]
MGGGNEFLVGMTGSAPDSARQKRCHDTANGEVRDGDTVVKNGKTSDAASVEKREKKEHLFKCSAYHGKDTDMWSGDQRINKSRVPAALCEQGREMDDDLNKTNSKERMMGVELDKEKTITSDDCSKVEGKKKFNTASPEEERKKKPHNASTGKNMQRDDDKEVVRIMSNSDTKVKIKKMGTSSGSNYKIWKEKLPHTLLKEKKRMWRNDSDKIYGGRVKELKIFSGGKEKNNQAPIAFLKFVRNNAEKFLVIPRIVAPRLEYLTNQLVYLKDSKGKCLKVLVSKVVDSLAFDQGWDVFVSNHLIKWGEFLLFEYIAERTFSVRVFGTDSCERLDFNPESTNKGETKKQAWSNMPPDDLVVTDGISENSGYYVSGECPRTKVPQTCHVTCNTKKDPKRVERVVGSGPVAQDISGNLIGPQCKTKGTPLCSKGKTVIMIIDSEDSEPSAHEKEDTMKLATSGPDSDISLVAVNTNEDPIRAQSGIGNGPSAVLADEKGNFPEIECGTKCISATCSEVKTVSQIISATALLDLHDSDENLGRKQRTNAIPLDSRTTAEDYHNYSKMIIIQNFNRKYEAPGGFRCLEKWRKDVVNNQTALDCTAPIKHENPQKTDGMLVDGYGLIELNPVDEYICSEGNHECVQPVFTMPIKEPSSADRVIDCGRDGTEINYSINEKDGEVDTKCIQTRPYDVKASVLFHSKEEEFIAVVLLFYLKQKENKPMGSIVHSQSNNVWLSANPVVAGKYAALGLNPSRSEGSCAFIESMLTGSIEKTSSPDEISKCKNSMMETAHNVNGKGGGTTAQFETKMDQAEPARSGVRSKICNSVVPANESAMCARWSWSILLSAV